MSNALIGVVTVIYGLIAMSLFAEGKQGLGVTFAAYALANVGLIMANPT